jgi:hypothetical protein
MSAIAVMPPRSSWSSRVPSRLALNISINAFPLDRHRWKILWFGPVNFPNPIDRNRQASVCVSLSKVSMVSELNGQIQTPIERYVSVGTLTILRVGDIFKTGRLTAGGSGTRETFSDIVIGPSTTETVKAGSSEDGHYLLPLQKHVEHQAHTKSYCVRVNLPDGRRLIVPCLELARFYFGSSSALLGKLFRPQLEREHLFHPEQSRLPKRQHMYLSLAEGIPARSAMDVARIVSTQEGWRSACWIGGSMALGGPECYIRTSFPFVGHTSLQARGRWLPHGDQPQQTFVVHELLSCSHPFPFKSLAYDEAPGTSRSKPAARKQTSPQTKEAPTSGDVSLRLVESDAGHLPGASFEFDDVVRFPDLRRKRISRRGTTLEIKPAGGCTAHASADAAEIAVGEPGSVDNIRPVEFEAEAREEAPEFLQPILDVLFNIPGLRVQPLTKGPDGWSLPLTDVFPIGLEQTLDISRAPSEDSAKPRRCGVLSVESASGAKTLVVVEFSEIIVEIDEDTNNSRAKRSSFFSTPDALGGSTHSESAL